MRWREIFIFVKELFRRINEDEVLAVSSQLAYSFLFAFFPFMIFLISLLSFTNLDSAELLAGLQHLLPRSVYDLIYKTIKEVMGMRSGGLVSFGLIMALFSAANGFQAVIRGLNKAYDVKEHRGFIKLQLIAITSTLGLVFIIIAAFVLMVFGKVNGDILLLHFGVEIYFIRLWNALRYVIIFFIMMLVLSVLYNLIPSRRLSWKGVMPGTLFATIGFVLCSEGFAYYINNFNSYAMIYGSIGAVIIFMTWLFFVSVILLVGGEINASLFLKAGN